jgi:hypothetical protein
MRHVIKKQVLELSLGTDRDMFRVQQKAGQYYYSHVLPALEKILDGLTDAGHIIEIDRLEIDLGTVAWRQEKKEMSVTDLYQKIEKEVGKAIQHQLDQKYLQAGDDKRPASIGKPLVHHACEQLLSYMRNGYLPWHLTEVNDIWRMQVLEALATDYQLMTGLRALIKDGNVLKRLVYDHPVSFLVKLAGVLTAEQQSSLPDLIQELEHPGQHADSLSPDKPPAKNAGLLWQHLLRGIADGSSVLDTINGLRGTEPGELFREKINSGKAADDIHTQNPDVDQLPGEGIFVPNAGLVLLHPFFKSLFARTGTTEDGMFISKKAREKAICLLHYIATGKTDAEEYQLASPKIICGYPLQQSAGAAALTEADKMEAADLMAAAMEQWTILKSTSTDGLREGFLQRSGKIYNKNGNICFAVESHAIDVLLDHLPWNLSIIKLPWMRELIKVTWR